MNIIFWLVIAFVIRFSYVLLVHSPDMSIFSDMANYVRIADEISQGIWTEKQFFQPIGFSIFLSFIKKITSHWSIVWGFINSLLSTLALGLMWKVTELSFGKKVAKVALIIGCFHLHWITYSGYALPEIFFTFFLSLLLWMTYKILATESSKIELGFGWGLLFILSFWLKASHVFIVPLFFLGLLFLFKRKAFLTIIPASLVMGLGLILHGLFTLSTINKFQLSASAGGLNFVEGKCPEKLNQDVNGIIWQSPIYYQMNMFAKKVWDEPFVNSPYFMKEGLKCILKRPSTLIQSFESIPFLFYGNTSWPSNQLPFASFVRLYELYLVLFMIPGLIVFFVSLNLKRIEDLLLWTVPIMALFLCVYVFKSEARFRVPFDVFIIPAAAKGWFTIFRYRQHEATLD